MYPFVIAFSFYSRLSLNIGSLSIFIPLLYFAVDTNSPVELSVVTKDVN